MTDEYIDKKDVVNLGVMMQTHLWTREQTYNAIFCLPSADVAPVRHGRWMKDVEGCLFCSNCHNTAEFNPLSMEQIKTPYCNVCGAKMDGGDTDA